MAMRLSAMKLKFMNECYEIYGVGIFLNNYMCARAKNALFIF